MPGGYSWISRGWHEPSATLFALGAHADNRSQLIVRLRLAKNNRGEPRVEDVLSHPRSRIALTQVVSAGANQAVLLDKAGNLHGLNTEGSGRLEALTHSRWQPCKEVVGYARNWIAVLDKDGSHLRLWRIHGATLMPYANVYQLNNVELQWHVSGDEKRLLGRGPKYLLPWIFPTLGLDS